MQSPSRPRHRRRIDTTTTTTKDKEEENLDSISNLSDDLLGSILSRLNTAHAVQTSILSKRWVHVWKSVSHLILPFEDDSSLDDPSGVQERAMSHILAAHSGQIKSCFLSHYDLDIEVKSRLPAWMEAFKAKRLSELTLDCISTDEATTPSALDMFAGDTIRDLSLRDWTITDAAAFTRCEGLVSLRLYKTILTDEVLAATLAGCRQLKFLCLEDCSGLNEVNITGTQSLQCLELQGYDRKSLKIDVPTLEKLSIDICTPSTLQIKFTKKLRSLNTTIYRYMWEKATTNVLSNIAFIYNELSSEKKMDGDAPFMRIQELILDVDLNNIRQVVRFSYLLRMCLELQKLDIYINKEAYNVDNNDLLSDYDWQKDTCVDCLEYTLRDVCIRRFRGRNMEVQFLEFLLKKGMVLERLNVKYYGDDEENERATAQWKKLLLQPRVSPKLKMQYTNR